MKRLIALAPVLLTASLLTAAPAQADDRRCRGTIGPVSVDGNVIVPSDATCTLRGTRVDGNVFVKGGAKLVARGIRVGGNIQADNHRYVEVTPRVVDGRTVRPRVGGSVQLFSGGYGEVRRAIVGGNVQTKQNERRQLVIRSSVDADVQAFSNDGGVRIHRNVIDGNLQCKSNHPRPTGDFNRVQGNKEDQCRNM
ncbi:MAG: hypothetical protein ACRDO2_13425 [Nocardioidaceae bacterium]